MSADRLYRPPGVTDAQLAEAAAAAVNAAAVPPLVVAAPTPPSGRTWLEAATAIPGRIPGRPRPPARAHVYRLDVAPDITLNPWWYWMCPHCDEGGGDGCLHNVLHRPGSWAAAFCGAFHHIHRRHPRPGVPAGEAFHTTLGGRRRCNWSTPTEAERSFASYVLCGRTGYPRGDLAREIAREVLALAGIRTPGP